MNESIRESFPLKFEQNFKDKVCLELSRGVSSFYIHGGDHYWLLLPEVGNVKTFQKDQEAPLYSEDKFP